MFEFCRGDGFLGTTATFCADLNLLAQIALALTLLVGAYFAVKKDFNTHQKIQSTVVVFNLFLIAFIMATSYTREIIPGLPSNLVRLRAQVSTVHLVLGALAWLAGLYIVLRMAKRTRGLIPERLRVKKHLKLFMRSLLALWWIVALIGISTYFVWYQPKGAAGAGGPEAGGTPTVVAVAGGQVSVPIENFAFQPAELVIPAGTTVTWTNFDDAPHTVTFDDGSTDSGLMDLGGVFTHTFATEGEFAYYCAFHGGPGGVGMSAKVRVVAVGQVAELPTAVIPPTATPLPTPMPVPAKPLGEPVAIAAYQDVLTPNDSLVIYNAGSDPVAPPPAGSVYVVWLLGPTVPNGRDLLGTMSVSADGKAFFSFVTSDPIEDRTNLVEHFNAIEITVETTDQPATPSGVVAFAAKMPDLAFEQIRTLIVHFDAAPHATGLAIGLRKDAQELTRQTEHQMDALQAGNLAEVKRRTEQVLNLLDGKAGTEYGDRNGDGKVQEPGDGYGMLAYAQGALEHGQLAAGAPDATDAIKVHGGHVQVCAQQTLDWATQLRGIEAQILVAGNLTAVQPLIAQAVQVAGQSVNGLDANGDGIIEPVAGECGAETLYEHAQYMAAFGLMPAGGTPTPGLVRVVMENFKYDPRTVTVTVGTTIVWVNFDNSKHSATSDTGVWDTGLFGYDEQAQFTFTQPGIYPYYCLAHGGAGGVGMSGTIVVTGPEASPTPTVLPTP
jgi:plastocyanin/uncharacterized membrane protein YozB (DUF420 family)